MFRPNRIGNHSVIDISAADFILPQSDAENLASLGTINAHQVQTDTATLGDPVSTINFNSGDTAKAWSLTANKSWSFGRFITGASLNNRSMMISYAAHVEAIFADAANDIDMTLNIGVANATSVTVDKTTTVNLMDTRKVLFNGYTFNGGRRMGIQIEGTFINSIFNGGSSGDFDTNPMGLWFSLVNFGTVEVITHIHGSLTLYRYSTDIDTFDPTR